MSSLREIIKSDLYRHGELKGVRGFLKGWFKPGFRYTVLFRYCHDGSSPFIFFLRLMKRHYRLKFGHEIDERAEIGEGFYLSNHVGPVIIGPVKIGKYCNISHCVTIGRSYKNGQVGRPTLGDRVWVGPGAVLVGKITIGSDVMVAPNAFVNVDVPDHSIAIGNPAKIISKQNPTKYYINHILPEQEN